MTWKKLSDRWMLPVNKARYQVCWNGKRWVAYLSPFAGSVAEIQWRSVIGVFENTKDARKACEEHYHAFEERVQSESSLSEHQKGDESGQAAEAGGRNRPVRRRKIKKEEVLTAQG